MPALQLISDSQRRVSKVKPVGLWHVAFQILFRFSIVRPGCILRHRVNMRALSLTCLLVDRLLRSWCASCNCSSAWEYTHMHSSCNVQCFSLLTLTLYIRELKGKVDSRSERLKRAAFLSLRICSLHLCLSISLSLAHFCSLLFKAAMCARRTSMRVHLNSSSCFFNDSEDN